MRFKLLIGLVVIAVLVWQAQAIHHLRSFLELRLVIPFQQRLQPDLQSVNSLKTQALEEEVRQLKKENQVMRRQLGDIPDKARLLVARVIWQGDHELVLSYQVQNPVKLVGRPVVVGEMLVGQIVRQSPGMLAVSLPVSSGFSGLGITESRIEGKLTGKFNSQVVFSVDRDLPLRAHTKVYFLDKEHGWRFLLGKVNQIQQDQRLSQQQAIVDFLPKQTQLTTVFVVLP